MRSSNALNPSEDSLLGGAFESCHWQKLLKEVSLMSISEEAVFKMGHIACDGNIANTQIAKKLPELLPNYFFSPLQERDDENDPPKPMETRCYSLLFHICPLLYQNPTKKSKAE